MIRLIVFLVILAALAALATFFADNPGSVRLEWAGVDVQTSIGVAAIALFAVLAVGVFVWEAIKLIVTAPKKIARANAEAKKAKGYQELTKGLVAAAAGDVKGARGCSQAAGRLLDDQAGPLLLEAQAAQLDGDEEVALVKFERMLELPSTKLLGLRGLISRAVQDGDTEEALRLIREAYADGPPSAPWVMTTMFDLASRSGHWKEARIAVDDMERAGLMAAEDAKRQRAICKIMGGRALLAEGRKDAAFSVLSEAAKLAPAIPAGAVEASKAAIELGKKRAARKVIEGAWRVHPHPELAEAYLSIDESADPAAKLKTARTLRMLRNDHPVTHMTIAELAIEASDKELAKKHLAEAVEKEPTARALRMWADLERAGGDRAKAEELAQRADKAAEERAWVCRETGEVVSEWSAFAPNGDFDGLRWTQPPVLAQMIGGGEREAPSRRLDDRPTKEIDGSAETL